MTTYAEIIEKCTCERLKSQVQMCQASQKILEKSKVEFKEKMEKSRKEKMVELQKKEEELKEKEEILDKLKKELRQLNDQQHVYQQLGEQRDVSDLGTTGEEELDKMFDNDDQ